MERLQLKCKPLDDLLGGGIESNAITEIHGEAGSGKTNLCLQASREYASKGKKVAYIDSEGVSLERLDQMCKEYDGKSILSNILFFSPSSLDEQEKMINNAININEVGLIVVDTINLFYRINLEDDKESTMRSFIRQIANLQITARKEELYVIVAEQVYTDKSGDIKPFTNRDTEHMVKTIIKLEKTGVGKRQATIIKHRSRPEGKKASFAITSTGLE
jgi:DNA repair protein RadB